MAFEQKNNSGVLFHSTKKGSENAPDYSGECTIDGVKLRIAGWKKTSQKGTTFLSLAFQPDADRIPPTKAPVKQELEDDIPF